MKTLILSIVLLATACFSQTYKLGWISDDGKKLAPSLSPNQWPIKTPLSETEILDLIAVLNQENIGSCVAHGTFEGWDLAYFRITGKHLNLSRLQIYFDTRNKEGTRFSDSGCQIVDAVAILMSIGAGEEKLWPYNTSKFTVKPPKASYRDGLKHLAIKAFKIDNTDGISIRLANTNGYPVIVGSIVYKGIMGLDKDNYILPMPKRGERPIGGHCYLVKGYKTVDGKFYYICRNSWDVDWGNNGDFLVPKEYIESGRITDDCWVIKETMK